MIGKDSTYAFHNTDKQQYYYYYRRLDNIWQMYMEVDVVTTFVVKP